MVTEKSNRRSNKVANYKNITERAKSSPPRRHNFNVARFMRRELSLDAIRFSMFEIRLIQFISSNRCSIVYTGIVFVYTSVYLLRSRSVRHVMDPSILVRVFSPRSFEPLLSANDCFFPFFLQNCIQNLRS